VRAGYLDAPPTARRRQSPSGWKIGVRCSASLVGADQVLFSDLVWFEPASFRGWLGVGKYVDHYEEDSLSVVLYKRGAARLSPEIQAKITTTCIEDDEIASWLIMILSVDHSCPKSEI
jgi:hypothetical protein